MKSPGAANDLHALSYCPPGIEQKHFVPYLVSYRPLVFTVHASCFEAYYRETDMVDRVGSNYSTRVLFGFAAGFLATLIFHQLTLWLLWGVGLAPMKPFSTVVTKPLGLPAVLSLAVWGGFWGILFSFVERRFPARLNYWVSAFVFGAVFPSAIALLVVLPLKGHPVGGGWQPFLLLTALLVNGAWGIGTGLFLKLLSNRFGRSHATTA